jgi:undecaprenyl pyrophosphate phosphatase UppP
MYYGIANFYSKNVINRTKMPIKLKKKQKFKYSFFISVKIIHLKRITYIMSHSNKIKNIILSPYIIGIITIVVTIITIMTLRG